MCAFSALACKVALVMNYYLKEVHVINGLSTYDPDVMGVGFWSVRHGWRRIE
jgi:hypothetical protein